MGKKGKIVSTINAKGGVGKTMTTQNLGHSLANQGRKVLILDIDQQCNTTSTLCGPDVVQGLTLYDIMNADSQIDPARCILPTPYDNMDILPNHPMSGLLEPTLREDLSVGYLLMRKILRNFIITNYDYALIDCPPDMGVLVYNAMIMSDAVIVPLECRSRYSIDGLNKALELIEGIQGSVNPDLRILRLLINKVDMRSSSDKSWVAQTEKAFPGQVFNTTIPENSDFKDAEAQFKTIIRHAPGSRGARKIRDLCQEFLSTMEQDPWPEEYKPPLADHESSEED